VKRNQTGEPLGLPRGSVRAVLAILLVMAAICLAFAGHLEDNQAFAALVVAAVSFYFAGRGQTAPAPVPLAVTLGTPTPKGD
jgi:asparagine N-glycosylation enzyme membrane subunit Stt3